MTTTINNIPIPITIIILRIILINTLGDRSAPCGVFLAEATTHHRPRWRFIRNPFGPAYLRTLATAAQKSSPRLCPDETDSDEKPPRRRPRKSVEGVES
jgi:hypothetical protein